MWVERTPEEMKKWSERTAKEARNHGRLMAGVVWILVSLMLAGGWVASARWNAVAQTGNPGGSFWFRCLVFGILILPFCWWLYRRESKRELHQATQRTICPSATRRGKAMLT